MLKKVVTVQDSEIEEAEEEVGEEDVEDIEEEVGEDQGDSIGIEIVVIGVIGESVKVMEEERDIILRFRIFRGIMKTDIKVLWVWIFCNFELT